MENAAQALKMGFAIFAFVASVSIAFMGITIAVEATNMVVESTDRTVFFPEVMYRERGELLEIVKVQDGPNAEPIMTIVGQGRSRVVGMDEVISNLYRYYVENFGIIILDSNQNEIARFDLATEPEAPWRGNSIRVRQRVEHFINPRNTPNLLSFFSPSGLGHAMMGHQELRFGMGVAMGENPNRGVSRAKGCDK